MAEITIIVKIEPRRWAMPVISLVSHAVWALAFVIGADRAIACAQPALRLVAKHGFRPVISG